MPANKHIAGTKNFCPGTRMARSYMSRSEGQDSGKMFS